MTAHKHAALMAQYAQDAAETDKPWLLWEVGSAPEDSWWPIDSDGPTWNPSINYRRKPDPVKNETRTYECWAHVSGYLYWCEKGGKMTLPRNWKRVPSEDKTVQVVL